MIKSRTIVWDGRNLPAGLRRVPPGKYRIESVDGPSPLTEQEERGIMEALDDLDAGNGLSLADVIRQIRRTARRK